MTVRPLFLIVVLDGLRRDMVTTELTPDLARFRAEGCDFALSRSVFPTETRVNSAALGSGCGPGRHGVVTNRFYDPRLYPDRLFQTGQWEDVQHANALLGGRFIATPSMGEALAAAHLTMAVIGSGSAGTTRFVNPRAAELGHIALCLRDWSASTPRTTADEILAAVGPIPPATRPNTARTRLQTRIFLDHVFPRARPDVSVLWYTDPDSTFHYKGIGSPEARQTLRDVDGEFGILLEWARTSGLEDRLQIIVLSDHGQIVARRKLSATEELGRSFRFGHTFADGSDYVLSPGYSGAIWARDRDRCRIARMVEALAAQSWIGAVWSGGQHGMFPGAFDRDTVGASHDRSADVYFTMATDDRTDEAGIVGGCFFEDGVPEGGGVHGGIHPNEINNVLMARGSCFRTGFASPWPCGIVDVAPTVLDLFGIPGGAEMNGRPLAEAYASGGGEPSPPHETVHACVRAGRRHALSTWDVNGTRYVARHWVE